jgi:hypothetical protein
VQAAVYGKDTGSASFFSQGVHCVTNAYDERDMKHLPVTIGTVALLLIAGCSAGISVVTPGGADGARLYAAVITRDAVSLDGLLAVHRIGRKFYFEIPDSLLDRDMLLVTRISQTPAGLSAFTAGGYKVGEQLVRWQRIGNRILLRRRSYSSHAADSLPIARSVQVSNFEPIVASFEVEAINPETGAAVIRVDDLFEKDVRALSGLSESKRDEFKVSRLDTARSFIDAVVSYPLNVNVRHTLTYEAEEPPSNSRTGTISMQLFQSMILLPEYPMRSRREDPRVGYLAVEQIDYGSNELGADTRRFIQRWRLEPSDPDAYARGELVEPRKPIVYYIDPATPEKWRPFIRAGVEDWQAPFESAGFRNAIVAAQPDSIDGFDPEDVRYSSIRYAASTTRNAMGPRVVDPRSGEIIESDIFWYHNHLRSYRNRLMIETGGANPDVRTLEQADEVIGEALRQVIAHEVGHALGFPHNMTASSAFPVDSLRSPTFTQLYGVAPSIMDYARQNYVAQPGDGVTRYVRKIGPYDHHAIEWGYRVLLAATPEQEVETLNEWIRARAGNPIYRFAPSQGRFPVDPRTQTEDIGDDPVAASTYAVANLRRVVPRLISWTARPGRDYTDLSELYAEAVSAWARYMGHVQSLVGGVFMTLKAADQPGPVYQRVPRARQEEAMQFLSEYVFATPAWLLDQQILDRIESGGAFERISGRQVDVLDGLLADERLKRLAEAEAVEPVRAYGLTTLVTDLRRSLWRELDSRRPTVDPYRRVLQRTHLERLIRFVRAGDGESHEDSDDRSYIVDSDLPALARSQLKALRRESERAAGRSDDLLTRVHLEDVVARIDSVLETE